MLEGQTLRQAKDLADRHLGRAPRFITRLRLDLHCMQIQEVRDLSTLAGVRCEP